VCSTLRVVVLRVVREAKGLPRALQARTKVQAPCAARLDRKTIASIRRDPSLDFAPTKDGAAETEADFRPDSWPAARRTSSANASTAGREDGQKMREIGGSGLGGAKSKQREGSRSLGLARGPEESTQKKSTRVLILLTGFVGSWRQNRA
jgi:hypothetical protein